MVSGLTVRSGNQSVRTDANGVARLTLPPGRRVLSVTGIGFKPAQVAVVVIADSVVRATVAIEMGEMEMAEVKVSATRIEKLAGETPTRVEVLDEMEVDENTLMAPSGITMLLNETPGLRVHHASPTLGTGSVRILGLPGQYTAMLADGLPLYGGAASALGPLDISPVDLQRVEIIKGAASALYGGQSLGGVINLVSKAPTGKNEVLINRRMLGVTDGAMWLSRKLGPSSGVSLLASNSEQKLIDIDGDRWADQAYAHHWNVRPRVTATDAKGRSFFLTAGYAQDNREGGSYQVHPVAGHFDEGLWTDRADVGGRLVLPAGDSGNAAIRFSIANSKRSREFGSWDREIEYNKTGFVEVTRLFAGRSSPTVIGTAVEINHFENYANRAFDHRWVTPGLFVTTERPVGPVTVSASVRGDAHPDAGVQVTERLAALIKPRTDWSVRMSVGTGFAPPTATTEETEAIGIRHVRRAPTLDPEHSVGSMLDINGKLAGAEILVTAYASAIRDAIQLADAADGTNDGILENTDGTMRIGGLEGAAIWRFEGGKFLGTYGYARGSRPDATTGVREPMPMLPRHRLGGDLMFEKEKTYRGGIEGIWYGKQALDDNPYRTESKPYLYLMAIYARQFGPLEAVANFENILNIRQTDTDPLVRPTQTTGGRWTTDIWAPVEGFMANVALRYRW